MSPPLFAIGQDIWFASFHPHRSQRVVCEDCGGTKSLTVIVFDGTEYAIPCQGCASGYEAPTGYILVYEPTATAEGMKITGMRINQAGVEYEADSSSRSYTLSDQDCFATREEALARAQQKADVFAAEELGRMKQKFKQHRRWAWHVTYHRRQIKEHQRQLALHEQSLHYAQTRVQSEKEAA